MSKLMIAVDYFDEYHGENDDDNHLSMEIFDNMKDAYNFAVKHKYSSSFVADFNTDYIYEEDGGYNYEDNSGLCGYKIEFDLPTKKYK